MAIYKVTYSCGHTGTINLFGAHAERDRKIAWLEREGICPDCYKAQKEAERAAATAAAKEENATLPQLEGSEKQVAWAETIRAKFRADLIKVGFKFEAAAAEEKGRNMLNATLYNPSAKWWIDNRNIPALTLAQQNYK